MKWSLVKWSKTKQRVQSPNNFTCLSYPFGSFLLFLQLDQGEVKGSEVKYYYHEEQSLHHKSFRLSVVNTFVFLRRKKHTHTHTHKKKSFLFRLFESEVIDKFEFSLTVNMMVRSYFAFYVCIYACMYVCMHVCI